TTAGGIRGDYSSAQNVFHISPRLSLTYRLGNNFSLNGGLGVFYQTIPMNYLAYNPGLKKLKDMKSIHYLLGIEYFSGTGTKISLEGYLKKYKNLPISPESPRTLIIDRLLDRSFDNRFKPMGYYMPAGFDDRASGYSWGLELSVQKKLVDKFYGILSATYFRSRYKDLLGDVHDRMFDNRYVINLTAGYKPDNKWAFSAKWTLMGGAPYTPVHVAQSVALNTSVLNESRFLGVRYPRYSTLNIRLDRRFYFGKSNLTVYVDLWNILDRENVTSYYWNIYGNTVESDSQQLSLVPILGFRYHF
ncbi:MAG: TonB-dependent receptor, partial [bacterium]|nr:TonB-dependent receptor [bacterium]